MRYSTRPRWPLLLAATLIATSNCRDVDVTTVEAAIVEISPAAPAVQVAQTVTLTARVLTSEGRVLSNREIEWRSLDTDIATVDQNGAVRGVAIGVATIRASSGGASGTVEVTVGSGPSMQVSPLEVAFTGIEGGAVPADRTVTITSTGEGTLTGLVVRVEYAEGEPEGWLSATLVGTSAPTSLVLAVDTSGLGAGTYSAIVYVSSPNASNGEVAIGVTFALLTPQPAIGLDPDELTFSAAAGTDPDAAEVAITNVGGGTLDDLAVSVTYPAGQPSGWIDPTLSTTTAPATLSVQPIIGALPAGRYTAEIRITSPDAASPALVQVVLDVGEADPAIGTSATSASFSVTTDDADPTPASISVTNSGGGTLDDLGVEVLYNSGEPAGWLSAVLSSATAPASLELTASRGTLPVGSYTARVRLTSARATNAPVDITVTFTISDVVPAAPSGLAATARSEHRIDLTWADESDNEASFIIERSISGGSWSEIATVGAGETAFVDSTGLAPSTAYLYRIRSCNAAGCSERSATVASTTAPAPASDVSASAIGPTRVRLAWSDNSSDETGFRIERSTDGVSWSTIHTTSSDVEQYEDDSASPETAYQYTVRACRLAVCSSASPPAAVLTGVAVPSTPDGLAATATSASRIELRWNPSSGSVDEYRVERRRGGGTFAQIATVSGATTFLEDTGLDAGTSYSYRVRACNASGCSPYSGTPNATTLPAAPAAPTGVNAVAGSSSRIDVSWAAATGTVGDYRVERRTGTSGAFLQVGTTSAGTRTFRDEGLTPATLYQYRVRACNAGGCSAFSATASATTLPGAPNPPTALEASPSSASQIDLDWEPAAGSVDDYHIERRTGTSGSFIQFATVSAVTTSFANTGLSANTHYFYRVRASNAGGFSTYAEASARTHPNPPTGLSATMVSESRIDLAWTAPAGGADSYRIERRQGSGTFTQIAVVTGTTHQDTGLEPATTYTYRVRACNDDGCSGFGNEATRATNARPAVSITAPTDGSSFPAGVEITFSATASDLEDGALTSAISWTSSRDGALGTGGSIERDDLSVGTHSIIASATDEVGSTGADTIAITVRSNTAPEVTLSAPADAATFTAGDVIVFAGSATDAEDGNLTASLTWSSDRDGTIGSGGSFERADLSVGTHTITATVTDTDGNSSAQTVTLTVAANTLPSVSITAPADGSSYAIGSEVTFSGTASDAEDGDLTSSIAWTSSVDGALGSGASITTSSLSAGAHTITASVADSHGGSATASITLAITDTDPEVTLATPADAATFTEGDLITFTGSASDVEDGDLTAALVWSSDIAGVIGSGGSVPRDDLAVGTHLITAAVTDSDGNVAAQSVTITVQPAVPGAPSALGARAVAETQIELSWSAAEGTVGDYRIERKRGSEDYAEIHSVPGGTVLYVDTDVESETEYTYRVRACNVSGCSLYSNEAAASTEDGDDVAVTSAESLAALTAPRSGA